MSSESVFSSDEMQLVTFLLGQESYGLNIMHVQEIIRTPAITVIPQAPDYVEGVANLRGNILPVVDTRVKFGMEKVGRDISSRVIVVDVRGKQVGLSVDSVAEVLRVESRQIEAAPAMSSEGETEAISGMVKVGDGKKIVMILQAENVCSIDRNGRSEHVNIRAAKNLVQDEKKIEEVQLVSFLLGKEEFALEIEHVREIIRYPEIVKVPNVPAYVSGVISLRDALMPIIDLRIKLDTGNNEISDSTRVIVVDVNKIRIGLVVDRVYEVTRISKDSILPPPQALSNAAGDRLQGIARLEGGKRIIMLLDPRDIMTREELQEISTAEANEIESPEELGTYMENSDEEQMVVFKLADEQYGVRITQVQEINRLSQISKVPRAPRFVEGVVNLRGDVIPVIDLRKRFDIEPKAYTEFTRIIVSDINKKKIGIIVDEVLEVLRIAARLLEDAPDILQGNNIQTYMDGIANLGNRMIMLLNLENLLVEKEWQKLDSITPPETPEKKTAAPRLKKQGRSE